MCVLGGGEYSEVSIEVQSNQRVMVFQKLIKFQLIPAIFFKEFDESSALVFSLMLKSKLGLAPPSLSLPDLPQFG